MRTIMRTIHLRLWGHLTAESKVQLLLSCQNWQFLKVFIKRLNKAYLVKLLPGHMVPAGQTTHRCNTMRRDKVSLSPLPHARVDPSFAHRDIHVHLHAESMRFVRHQSNRTMLSQNVTCSVFGATCDRFVSPIMYVKELYTLLMEVESAVPIGCFNFYWVQNLMSYFSNELYYQNNYIINIYI